MPTLFLKLTKIWQRENGKFVDFNDPTQVWRRPRKKRRRISTNALCCQKLESLAYIFVAACMGLSSFKFVQWAPKTHFFCIRVRFGRSRSFRVTQGRWFWYQSKARIRLPISRPSWLWSYLAPFLRYGDTVIRWLKIAYFCYIFATPLSFGALAPYVSLGISRWS